MTLHTGQEKLGVFEWSVKGQRKAFVREKSNQ